MSKDCCDFQIQHRNGFRTKWLFRTKEIYKATPPWQKKNNNEKKTQSNTATTLCSGCSVNSRPVNLLKQITLYEVMALQLCKFHGGLRGCGESERLTGSWFTASSELSTMKQDAESAAARGWKHPEAEALPERKAALFKDLKAGYFSSVKHWVYPINSWFLFF